MFDRAAILRSAHATARWQVATYRAAGTLALSGLSYRKAFASALRSAWRVARDRAEVEAYEASLAALPPIPADIAKRAHQLEADAWGAPITMRGNDDFSALMAQARDLRDGARASFHA